MNLPKADNHTDTPRTREWRSRPCGIETQGIASRLFFPDKGKKTGVNRTPDVPTEPQCHAQTEGKPPQQNRKAAHAHPRASIPHSELPPRRSPRAQTPVPELKPARPKRRAGPQFTTLRNRPASRRASAEQRFRAKPAPHYRRPARLRPMVGRVVWCYAAASGSRTAAGSKWNRHSRRRASAE